MLTRGYKPDPNASLADIETGQFVYLQRTAANYDQMNEAISEKLIDDREYITTPNERLTMVAGAIVHDSLCKLAKERATSASILPDDQRFAELGKALAIGDMEAVQARLRELAQSPPEELKLYWWQFLAMLTQPEVAERPTFEEDALGRATLPAPEPNTIFPMPESQCRLPHAPPTPVGDFFGSGHPPPMEVTAALFGDFATSLPSMMKGEQPFTLEELDAALGFDQNSQAPPPRKDSG